VLRGCPFRLMFQDEGRFGRITNPHSAWCQKGVRPQMGCQLVREYTYAYAALSPLDGDMDSFILPNMYADTLSVFLKEVACRHNDEYIVIVLDRAPCHRSGELTVPDNMQLIKQPPYSPELNPVEHVWDEMKEKWFSNRTFESMDAVEEQMIKALNALENDHERIKTMSQFPWIMRSLL